MKTESGIISFYTGFRLFSDTIFSSVFYPYCFTSRDNTYATNHYITPLIGFILRTGNI